MHRVLHKAKKAFQLAWALQKVARDQIGRSPFPRSSEKLLEDFVATPSPSRQSYDGLFKYFAEGWQTYRRPGGAGATYPGLPSWSGRRVDELEGFARIMPLFGAWVNAGRQADVVLQKGAVLSLPEEFERGLVAGTDGNAKTYWGDMVGRSPQQIVEAADIALALWFFRDSVWNRLTKTRQQAIVDWLSQIEGCPGLDNNWHLFYVIIDRILSSLGYSGRIPSARERFDRIKKFHLGDGWFRDGPSGRIDFYSAWGFHYALYWIDHIDPDWDSLFVRSCQRRFLETYPYLIGPDGIPILGRSICYRLAAPAPLVFGYAQHPDLVSAGMARRGLDCTWQYFIRRGAVRNGWITQGYFDSDARLLDNYSGPASCLWSLRSLIAAFHLPVDDPFWTSQASPLPVECGDFKRTMEGPRWQISGNLQRKSITIEILDNVTDDPQDLDDFGFLTRLRSIAYDKPLRPKNEAAKYGRRYYHSDPPFFMNGHTSRGSTQNL